MRKLVVIRHRDRHPAWNVAQKMGETGEFYAQIILNEYVPFILNDFVISMKSACRLQCKGTRLIKNPLTFAGMDVGYTVSVIK